MHLSSSLAAVICCSLFFSTSALSHRSNAGSAPTVVDSSNNVTYTGVKRNGLDAFLGIRFGQDTSGEWRFKPPRSFTPENGSHVDATTDGVSCMQPPDSFEPPLSFTNNTDSSEDCLFLNLFRPNNTKSDDKLPVLLFIYGGSFVNGANNEITTQPDGLILRSVENKTPIISIQINYRLGIYGFATSDVLMKEGSTNAGLRDQRLGIEWARDNVAAFGGDPNKITIHGQSSGGLAVGMQTLAYGGTKPVPFQQGICESQALDLAITSNVTRLCMEAVISNTKCSKYDLDSEDVISCLRKLPIDELNDANTNGQLGDYTYNGGDSWLPVVDGDFLPDAPSKLLAEKKFANITTMILWADNDMQIYTDQSVQTSDDVYDMFSAYLPGFSEDSLNDLLDLYPVDEFHPFPGGNETAEWYRAARIYRDLLMTCQPIGYGQSLANAGNTVYLIDQNATLLPPGLKACQKLTGMGSVHTSEFPYSFGNLSHYNQTTMYCPPSYEDTVVLPFNPTEEDYRLEKQEAGTWASFTYSGKPSIQGGDTLQGFEPAFSSNNPMAVYVAGGPYEGLSYVEGSKATNPALVAQKLGTRCGFINSPSIVAQMQY